ncbi:hypothetical protein JAAARDRAFT_34114 [Jaapia argillacea MUCL 33604]|uniref:Uncharacterized protein n=1 Tax=Jaapia argillacea MUCL 33604 TaxID=933084 RepID=A0A067PU95_9AGAM|nr:hypothetical protein JAAARDRAFT_34114 [Jaapia argillacea MUCL 33604]
MLDTALPFLRISPNDGLEDEFYEGPSLPMENLVKMAGFSSIMGLTLKMSRLLSQVKQSEHRAILAVGCFDVLRKYQGGCGVQIGRRIRGRLS